MIGIYPLQCRLEQVGEGVHTEPVSSYLSDTEHVQVGSQNAEAENDEVSMERSIFFDIVLQLYRTFHLAH